MSKANRHLTTLLVYIVLMLCSCGQDQRQSDSLDAFVKTNFDSLRGFYFYPSTVRMLGEILGADDGAFLSEVKEGRVLVVWEDDEKIENLNFKSLKRAIETEGFEMLISMKSNGVKVDAYERDGKPSLYILIVDDAEHPFIVEMAGTLSMEAIRQVMTMDFQKANDLLNLFPEPKEETQIESTQAPDE